jgi:NTE family protein
LRRPKIGLALGSGGVRGYAHIGVLKVLMENQIPIDFLAGSSMGSVVAVLFANGLNLDLLVKLATHMKRKHLFDYTVPRMGFIRGEKIKELIRLLTHGKKLEDLRIPTSVVATDLLTGERVVFRHGSIEDAVRASIAIPGVFEPVAYENRLLFDGGVIDRVPVGVVKEMGADLVIAVDVAREDLHSEVNSLFEVIAQTIDIMEREIFKYRILDADVVIRPKVGHQPTISFDNIEAIVKEGEESAREMIGIIQQRIREWEEIYDKKI